MGTQAVRLHGAEGGTRRALLELPVGPPRGFALFAHGFGGAAESPAPPRLSRALAERGLGVLALDVTEDGAPRVEDLVAAAHWLREHLQAPRLLVGHGLAGTALVRALPRVPEAQALATLNAPAGDGVLRGLLGREAAREGAGTLLLGERRVHLAHAFLEELAEARVAEALEAFEGELLVLHAPLDVLVPLEESRRLLEAAHRPGSFVALQGADHFLRAEEDADFAAGVLGAWAGRYVAGPPAPVRLPPGVVEVREASSGRFAQDVLTGTHRLRVDEPREVGGEDSGPSPYGLLAAALGACTSMTLRLYAEQQGWPLTRVGVRLLHAKVHAQDCAGCARKEGRVDRIEREVVLEGPLSEGQRARLLQIAERCPVHRTLESEVEVHTRLEERAWWEEGIPAGG